MEKYRIKKVETILNDGTKEISYKVQVRKFLKWNTMNLWYRTCIDDHLSQRLCVFKDKIVAEKLLKGLKKSQERPFGETVTAFPVWNTSGLCHDEEYYTVLYFCFTREVFSSYYYHLRLHTWEEQVAILGKLPKISIFSKTLKSLFNKCKL